MAFKYLKHTALLATLLHLTAAQQKSNIIPDDLKAGFASSGTEMQVSFTNEAVNGFRDGTLFDKDGGQPQSHFPLPHTKPNIYLAVSQEPTFAMGDSSGIVPSTLYTIIMLDTTCPTKRTLHYARANFKISKITNIDTSTAPVLAYKAPGALAETGDARQYSFLMYVNPQRKVIESLKMPADGEAFDAKKFKDDNGFQDPAAGVGMVVKLGGIADCGGEAPGVVPSSLPAPRPARSSNAVGGGSRSTGVAVSSVVSSAVGVSSAAPSGNGSSSDSGSGGASAAPGLPVATSAVQSGIATQTLVLSSAAGGAGVGASNTASASLAQQTVNAAPGAGAKGFGLFAPLVAVAGLIVW